MSFPDLLKLISFVHNIDSRNRKKDCDPDLHIECFIERLYAHKQYVGKRVGHLLMQTCIAYARKKDVQTLWLGVWENNARAISFYQKNGFQKFGHHTFMLGDDAQSDWLMKKELS